MTVFDIIMTICTGGLWIFVMAARGINSSVKTNKEIRRGRWKF